MNAITYNVAISVALALISSGVGMLAGVAVALVVLGTLVLALTVFGATMSRRK